MARQTVTVKTTSSTSSTKTTTSSKSSSSTPKSANHPVDCCVHKNHSKKP